MKVLGIDIGGSAVKGAPVDIKTGRLLAERFRLEASAECTPAAVAKLVAQVTRHFHWHGPIGVGFPGVIHGPRIRTSANLHPRFVNCDAARLFGKATGCPVTMVNDADAAGLAEVRFGAGRDVPGTILLLTLGTGIGSALFCHGKLYQNSELGHFPLRGRSAERYVSAAARKRRKLDWEQWAGELNGFLHSLEEILWPQLIIIGGGVSAKHRKYFKYLQTRAKLVPAKLLNEAGTIGAALWAAEQG